MNQSKYKISEEKGVELFLKPDSPFLPEKTGVADEDMHPKGLRLKIILTLICFFLLTGSLFHLRTYIRETRVRLQELTSINQKMDRLSTEMNFTGVLNYEARERKDLADSLIVSLNNYLYRYPNRISDYNQIWPTVVFYRYLLQWHNHSYHNLENQPSVHKLDIILEQKLLSIDPDLGEILHLLYHLHDFYYYKSLYPLAPESAVEPVPEAMVKQLLVKSGHIRSIFATHSGRLDIHFRPVANLTRIVLNSYMPEIKQWSVFWQLYHNWINSEDGSGLEAIIADLKIKFPNLRLLENYNSKSLSEYRNLYWGLLENDLVSMGITKVEFEGLLRYMSKTTGRSINPKFYNSYTLMKRDFIHGKLDFCKIGHENIYSFAENRQADPILFRMYNDQPYKAYYLYSKSGQHGTTEDIFESMADKNLLIRGTVWSDIFFETIDFFLSKGFNLNDLFASIEFIPEISDLQNFDFSDFDFLLTSSEDFGNNVSFGVSFDRESPIRIKKALNDAVFTNIETVNLSIIEDFAEKLTSLSVNDHKGFSPPGKWNHFDYDLFDHHLRSERLDRPHPINQIVLKDDSFQDAQNLVMKDRFIQTLFTYGYNVISEHEYNKFLTTVMPPPAKMMNLKFIGSETIEVKVTVSDSVVFSMTTAVPSSLEDNNFDAIVENMSKQTGFQSEIIEIQNDILQFYSPLNRMLRSGFEFNLFDYSVENDSTQDKFVIQKSNLGTARYNSLKNQMAILVIDQIGEHRLQTGNYVAARPSPNR